MNAHGCYGNSSYWDLSITGQQATATCCKDLDDDEKDLDDVTSITEDDIENLKRLASGLGCWLDFSNFKEIWRGDEVTLEIPLASLQPTHILEVHNSKYAVRLESEGLNSDSNFLYSLRNGELFFNDSRVTSEWSLTMIQE